MAYNPYYTGGWQSGEEGNTPITPDALNHMDTGIGAANDLDATPTQGSTKGVQSGGVYTAIQQSTAVETISQSNYITLSDGIQIERWDGVKKCGRIIQASFVVSKTDGTSFGAYMQIGSIKNPYRPLMRFTEPASIASSISSAAQINGNFLVTTGGAIAIYATASNSNVVYVSMTYMIN